MIVIIIIKMATGVHPFKKDGQIDWAEASKRLSAVNFYEETVTPVDWTDAYFKNIYIPLCQVNSRPDLAQSILYAKSFLSWYVSGNSPKDAGDLVLGLLYEMTLDCEDNFVFPDTLMRVSDRSKSPWKNRPAEGLQLHQYHHG